MIHDIEIELPVRTVYDQWTQFEDFHLFMDHVKQIEQIDDLHVRWTVKISGVTREWTAEITEQTPDQRIAWTATDGTKNSGVVSFHPLSDTRTRIVLQLEMDPEGFLEKVADWGGYMADRAKKDLAAFKEFIEDRGRPTGAWRGRVKRSPTRDQEKVMDELLSLDDEALVHKAKEVGVDDPLRLDRRELAMAIAHESNDQ